MTSSPRSVSGAEKATTANERTPESARQRVSSKRVLVIGHRGDSKIAPENTLPAFTSAVTAGADLVELDYHHSADNAPTVIHDGTLDRTTNAASLWSGTKIKVNAKNLAELKRLDAGSWFDPRFAGTRLPTLVEALAAIQPGSMTLIERKGGDSAACVALLQEQKLLEQVVVQAFDWDFLVGCHRLAPGLVLGALGEKELTGQRLDEIAKTGATVVGWGDKSTSAQTIAAIHDRGWKAWVWTVDDPGRMRELIEMGVDGLITNTPAKAREVVSAAGRDR